MYTIFTQQPLTLLLAAAARSMHLQLSNDAPHTKVWLAYGNQHLNIHCCAAAVVATCNLTFPRLLCCFQRALRSQSSPALEPSQFGYIVGYTGAIKFGHIPESLKFDLHPSTSGDPENPGSLCEYQNPCGSTLSGTLDVTPRLDRFNVNEIFNRDWVPKSGVKLVCTLAPGQDAVQQCQP